MLVAGVSDTFLAGDLFNLYVGFELMLTASYVLMTIGGTLARIRAGATYAIVSLLSSMLFLAAVAMVYAAAGTVTMAQLPSRLDALPESVAMILQIALLVVFAIKAAVFPLAAWLPDSYPTAPAPVTAVFAGLLTKVGIYAILRTRTLLFPGGIGDVLMVLALLSLLVGILGAVAQTDLKRLLSFTLVSHMGYMVFGIGLGSPAGISGAVFYVAHHITVQTTLFLVAGLIERRTGTTDLQSLGGLARLSPLLAVLFFVPALNLAGIPPLSGFLGKLGLLRAGVDDGGALAYLLVAGGTVTSLLTLYALTKAWNVAFWRARDTGDVRGRHRAGVPGGGHPRRGRRGRRRLRRADRWCGIRRRTAAAAARCRRRVADRRPLGADAAPGDHHLRRPGDHHHQLAPRQHGRSYRGPRPVRARLHRARGSPVRTHRPRGGRNARPQSLRRGGDAGMTAPQRLPEASRMRATQWPMVCGLTLLWLLLWGTPPPRPTS